MRYPVNHFYKIRKEYDHPPLLLEHLLHNPLEQLNLWLNNAIDSDELEPNAMILATATTEGKPSTRTVLLKKIDTGILFFTNLESRKALEISSNPYVSATLLWKKLSRQICFEGKVEQISRVESEVYFQQRPRGSQLGSSASRQDTVIPSRKILDEELARLEKLYINQKIPLPLFWGGFRIIPTRFEFWQGQQNRLHDRFRYSYINNSWKIERLSP